MLHNSRTTCAPQTFLRLNKLAGLHDSGAMVVSGKRHPKHQSWGDSASCITVCRCEPMLQALILFSSGTGVTTNQTIDHIYLQKISPFGRGQGQN